jgi:hypothetical protein
MKRALTILGVVCILIYIALIIIPGRSFHYYVHSPKNPGRNYYIYEDGYRVEYIRNQPIFESERTFGAIPKSFTHDERNLVERPGTYHLFGQTVSIGFYRFSTDRTFTQLTPKKIARSYWQRRWITPTKTVLILVLEQKDFREGLKFNLSTRQSRQYVTGQSNRKKNILLQVPDSIENRKLILDPNSSLNRNRMIHVGEADQKN